MQPFKMYCVKAKKEFSVKSEQKNLHHLTTKKILQQHVLHLHTLFSSLYEYRYTAVPLPQNILQNFPNKFTLRLLACDYKKETTKDKSYATKKAALQR